MWVVMSAAEREEFLAGVHVGVLSAAAGQEGRTLAVPVWYRYQPGGLLTVLTGRRDPARAHACGPADSRRSSAASRSSSWSTRCRRISSWASSASRR